MSSKYLLHKLLIKYKCMFDFVIYFITGILTSLILYNYNLLFTQITLDSLFSAIHFIKTFFNNNLTESQIVITSNLLYKGTLLDRYIYYSIIYLLYKSLCIFFWISDSNILYYIGLLTIIPNIFNKILSSKLFHILRNKKELLVKVIIAKIFTMVIKTYSKLYLERDTNIKYSELLLLLDDYKNTINYFLTVLKNALIIIGLSYAKHYSTSLYYGIIKYVYNYKTGDLIASYNIGSAKQYLIDILENRKWHNLTKPNTYKAMLYLYQMNNDKSDYLRKLVNECNLSLVKMFTVWTIASLFEFIYLIPLISLCFILYKKTDRFFENLFVMVIGLVVGYIFPSYMMVSAVCQYGTNILFNKVTYIAIKVLVKVIKNKVCEIIKNNRDLLILYIITISYTIVLKHLLLKEGYIFLGLNLMANVLMSTEIKKQLVFNIIIISSHISNYNILHVIFNSITLYIITGIIDKSDMYTYQDIIKILIENFTLVVIIIWNFVLNIFRTIHKHYYIFKKYIRCKLNIVYYFKYINDKINPYHTIDTKNKNKNVVFDLMDTCKISSVSFFDSNIMEDDSVNKPQFDESVSIDDEVFNQTDDMFINGICVEDNCQYTIEKINNVNTYAIVNDYFK